jgi:hypothetical protein
MLGMHISLGGQVTPIGGGARLVLHPRFEAQGLLGLALPGVGRRMRRELQRDVETIKTILESAPAEPVRHRSLPCNSTDLTAPTPGAATGR